MKQLQAHFAQQSVDSNNQFGPIQGMMPGMMMPCIMPPMQPGMMPGMQAP